MQKYTYNVQKYKFISKSILINCEGIHMTNNSTFHKNKCCIDNNLLDNVILLTIRFLTNYGV